MKPILQAEAAECGLACLAMIASHHGMHQNMLQMRQRFALSLKGMNLSRLMSMANDLGMNTRALRLDLDNIGQLQLPCILHWGMSHFVVLEQTRAGKATIIDPDFGRRVVTAQGLSEKFTGVALELSPSHRFERTPAVPAVSIGQLSGKITGLKRGLGMILLLSLTLQGMAMLAPFLLQWVVDQVLVAADLDLMVLLGIGFGLVITLQVATALLRGWAVVYLSSRLGLQWMANVYCHLLRLPLDFFQKRHLGDITSRMASVKAIQTTLTTSFVEAIIDGLMAVSILAMMLLYSAKLALVSLLTMLLYMGIRALAFRSVRSMTEQQMNASASQQSYLLESMRGMQSIKIAGAESMRQSRYLSLMHETVGREVSLAHINLGFNNANHLILGLERIAVVWIGATLAIQGVFSVGMLIAYLAYREQFTQRVSALIDKSMELRMLRLHGERLADIVLAEPEATGTLGAASASDQLRIEVRHVGFRYADGDPWVLKDCNFVIEPGQSLAIVGASGCGKTTLVRLLLGLIQPSEGRISVGGVDLASLDTATYRRMIGAVMQDDQLFAGSIAENIAFNDDSLDLQEIEAAARLAAIHDEITSMPMRYQSLIGDMGTTLSGGQKQRVILARALYRRPRILFLDEATSHLDVEREKLVNSAVGDLQITRVIVAHRPETIASADRVIRLEQGRIVADYRPVAESSTTLKQTAWPMESAA